MKAEMDDCVFRKKKKVSWREVDSEGVVIDLTTGSYYSLNEMGLKVWCLLDGKNTIRKICTSIASVFRTDQKRAQKDLRRFLLNLQKQKLIEKVC